MPSILELIGWENVRHFQTGDLVLEQGHRTGMLFFLIEGDVEVLRDDVRVARVSEPGVVFGEMSLLLDRTHTASVRALRPSAFSVIENPRSFLEASPQVSLQMNVGCAPICRPGLKTHVLPRRSIHEPPG